MGESVLADAGFLVALLSRRDSHHGWATAQAERRPPPWRSCEAALSEAFHLLGPGGRPALCALLNRQALAAAFDLGGDLDSVLKLMHKYSDIPASLADACLVRMTEVLPNPMLLTTDTDFRIYRRLSRQTIPCATPGGPGRRGSRADDSQRLES